MEEQNSLPDDEMQRLCQHLLFHSEYKLTRRIQIGSHFEIQGLSFATKSTFGLKRDTVDVDIMHYRAYPYAFPQNKQVPIDYCGDVYRICTHGVHPGFSRLIEETSGRDVTHAETLDTLSWGDISADYIHRHGPALQFLFAKHLQTRLPNCHAANDVNMQTSVPLVDHVMAIHSPYWPAEASEWITRTRGHGCPSKPVIKQVIRYGCDIVGVAPKTFNNNYYSKPDQWRFSFSKAELLILLNWTSSQRIAYRVLKLTYKLISQRTAERNEESVLCSYYIKTLMLWACEERPKEFWAERALPHSISQLLIEMSEWLTSKFCCNYFIRDNNMMDHLMDTDVSGDVTALRFFSSYRYFITSAILSCTNDESKDLYTCEMPNWFYRSVRLLSHIRDADGIDAHQSSKESFSKLQFLLLAELIDVFQGLTHVKVAQQSSTEAKEYLRRAEWKLKSATNLCKSRETSFFDIGKRDIDLIGELFVQRGSCSEPSTQLPANYFDERLTSNRLTGTVQLFPIKKRGANLRFKCMLYERTAVPNTSQQGKININAGAYVRNGVSLLVYENGVNRCTGESRTVLRYYHEWPGVTLSVNASWFIARAYLANLYYTQRRYEAALETCNDVVRVYKRSLGNQWLAEETFPVLLSTEWTAVYDAQLQALLGLCSLCAFVSNRTDYRSACLVVCPVFFALYLKARCLMDQEGWPYQFSGEEFKKELLEHLRCEGRCVNSRPKYGVQVLLTIITMEGMLKKPVRFLFFAMK